MRPTVETDAAKPSRSRSLAIFLLPHIGLSARTASTASMRAGGHFGWRGRLGRRDRGSGVLSHRYSVARGTPRPFGAQAIGDRAAPARHGVASSRGFDIWRLRREKTRRRSGVSDNMSGQATNLHGGLLRLVDSQLSAWETPSPFFKLPSHICLAPDRSYFGAFRGNFIVAFLA